MRRIYLWPLIIVFGAIAMSVALVGDTQLWGGNGNTEPLPPEAPESLYFHLELQGEAAGNYDECSGLGSYHHIEENMVVTDAAGAVIRKVPGALEWSNITLKRAGLNDRDVWSWRKAMEDGKLEEAIRDGAIIMIGTGPSGLVARWNFQRGWAARLTFDGFVVSSALSLQSGIRRRVGIYCFRQRLS